MKKQKLLTIITIFILLFSPDLVFGQENGENPIYIVQSGENLSSIAQKFGIDVNDLIAVNNIVDLNLISAGSELIIPGLEGISGVLTVTPIRLGETIPVILKKYQISNENLLLLNKITSPAEAFVGTNLVLPVSTVDEQQENDFLTTFNESSSILFESIVNSTNHWSLSLANKPDDRFINLPHTPITVKSDDSQAIGSIFSPYIQDIVLTPLPFSQGHTLSVKVYLNNPADLNAVLDGHALTFYPDDSDKMLYALDSVHALREPGLANLTVSGIFDNGDSFQIDQMVLIESGGYVQETLTVESTLIDEDLNIQESIKVQDILANTNTEKYWQGFFRYPVDGSLVDETIGFSSYFGNRRTYNAGEYFGFHGGLDFFILLNTFNTYAVAPGVVVFAGPMDIRGNTIFIDHGQGVFSGYAHLNEIQVEEGQYVNQGDLIGQIGKTGRVTGPHLHWDIWVNGNQVDPFDWIYNQYP